jgi:acetyl-CoA acetyltransferase
VLVYRALNGASGLRYGGVEFTELLERTSVHSDAESQFLSPYGVLMPAHEFALLCRRHMIEYGTTNAQLGAIATTCRAHANLNPRAQMRDRPMSMDDYLASPWIAEPFRVFDCCLMSDGACALLVTSAEQARDLRHRPVYLMAGGIGTGPANRGGMWGNYWHDHAECYARYMADQLYADAGVGPADIDLAELYDCFTYSVIAQLEDFGFCAKGEGGPFCEGGRIGLDGELPVNTHGGLLSEAYIHGLNGVCELVEQLRGDAGARQVKDAEIGMATAGGASANGSAVILRH